MYRAGVTEVSIIQVAEVPEFEDDYSIPFIYCKGVLIKRLNNVMHFNAETGSKKGFHILVLSLIRSQKFSLHVHNILQAVHLQDVSLPIIGNIFIWVVYFLFTSQFIALINNFCINDTTLRIINTRYNCIASIYSK